MWDSPILHWPVEWGDHQGGPGGICNCGSCAPTPPVSGRIKGRHLSASNCRSPCSYPVGYDTCPNASPGSEADKGQPRSRSVAVCAWDRNQSEVTPRHAISTRASQRTVPVCRDIHRQHESRIFRKPIRWLISRVAGRWVARAVPRYSVHVVYIYVDTDTLSGWTGGPPLPWLGSRVAGLRRVTAHAMEL